MLEFTPLTDEEIKTEATRFKSPEDGVYKMKVEACVQGTSRRGLPMLIIKEASLLTITKDPKDAFSYVLKGAKDKENSGVYYITLSPNAMGLFALAMSALGLKEKYKTGKISAEDLVGKKAYAAVVQTPTEYKGEIKKFARIYSIQSTEEEARAALADGIEAAKAEEKKLVTLMYQGMEAQNSSLPEAPKAAETLSDDVPW